MNRVTLIITSTVHRSHHHMLFNGMTTVVKIMNILSVKLGSICVLLNLIIYYNVSVPSSNCNVSVDQGIMI